MLRSIAAGDKLASAWCRRAFGSVPKIVTIEVEAGWTTPLKHQLFRPAACLGFNKLAPRLDSSNVPIKKNCEGFFFRLRLRCYMKTTPIPGKPHPSGSCRAAWQQKPPEVSVPCWREQQEPLPRRRRGTSRILMAVDRGGGCVCGPGERDLDSCYRCSLRRVHKIRSILLSMGAYLDPSGHHPRNGKPGPKWR